MINQSSTAVTVTASVVSTTETTLKTFAFNKDELYVGMVIRMTANGTFTQDGTRQFTLRTGVSVPVNPEFNSVTSPATALTDKFWELTWTGIIATIGSSGTIETALRGSLNTVLLNDLAPNTATVSINTAATLTFALTCQWNANNAGNAVTIRQFILEIL